MPKNLMVCVVMGMIAGIGPGWAAESAQVSCKELVSLADGLEEVTTVFEAVGQVAPNTPTAQELTGIVVGLKKVAQEKKQDNLTKSLTNLEETWKNSQWNDFIQALGETTGLVDTILALDCPAQ